MVSVGEEASYSANATHTLVSRVQFTAACVTPTDANGWTLEMYSPGLHADVLMQILSDVAVGGIPSNCNAMLHARIAVQPRSDDAVGPINSYSSLPQFLSAVHLRSVDCVAAAD